MKLVKNVIIEVGDILEVDGCWGMEFIFIFLLDEFLFICCIYWI